MDFFVYNFSKFMLVFSRIMGLYFTSNFFSSKSIPNQVKLGLVFFTTAIMYPMVSEYMGVVPDNMIAYSFRAMAEGIIGVSIGFAISISFTVFQLAGQFFTVQMGFGASEVFDPMSQISLPLMGQYIYMIFTLVFMILNGPALIINAIYNSFQMINFHDLISISLIQSKFGLVTLFSDLFYTALKISLPMIGALLMVSITMGLLAKAAPQMNLLMIGFPISISVGFIILLFMTPILINLIVNLIDFVFNIIWNMMLEIDSAV
ncbi:MAG: flagellar biosynthetic protein FliR [Spirochaetes bacterium GWF1_31_7]|nr:MAG: flagellar biosynthetic protein FliR [Spirochaetes bacterium GWE1_32_154]OHD45262.1 MAG: flagellar biosynthetic protein FliR [Spirochaetes bacterium GWE2_31_10]OHD50557.1 MAG: flagellar biosynthetic protein FliR [Spirochaetes bacterium GWF1_31_7]OHD78577.1 MAG: flagellar biosynthetic protein FliR [Spirochaetes bacterium RIFOXYB1_FULL_32_8]HBD94590.1 flagellar biosynthetic protein FliR [Spirochaetia bacterium]